MLEAALEGWRGQLLRRAADLKFALEAGFELPLDEIQADEFIALKAIKAEIDAHALSTPHHEGPVRGVSVYRPPNG